MKKLLIFAMVSMVAGCAGFGSNDQTVEFTIETVAMGIGYDQRNAFAWTPEVDAYYNAIMAGTIDLDGAKAAEGYLRRVTHPLIANRLVRLAGMVGFDLTDMGTIAGIGKVDVRLLQVAAQGFRMGLLLAE